MATMVVKSVGEGIGNIDGARDSIKFDETKNF
jgi:hypothetical protein